MARTWRSSSKARLIELGQADPILPSIDEVHAHLQSCAKVCTYCGVRLAASGPRRPNLDHRHPISRGGDASVANLALACRACNSAKGPLNETEFRSLLAFLGSWDDRAAAESLLSRLRGAYWCYRVPKARSLSESPRRGPSDGIKWVQNEPLIEIDSKSQATCKC